MNNLDDFEAIKKLDTANVLGSIEQLDQQCQQAWEEVSKIKFPDSYRQANSIVFSGMGGSALPGYIIKSLFSDSLKIPFDIVNDYHLPVYVNSKTLVILGSYSGSTEETIACALEAKVKKTMITGFTTGNNLAQFFQNGSYAAYVCNPKFNPANQPRLGIGYSLFSQIVILSKLNLIKIEEFDNQVQLLSDTLEKGNQIYGVSSNTSQNQAKKLALRLLNKIPVFITAEFLGNVGRVFRNEFNENAKSYADYHLIPELNHYLLEGLINPSSIKESLKIIFINSSLYSSKIQKRFAVTKEVIKKQGLEFFEFMPKSESKIVAVLETIQFGSYVNYYLAMLYNLDPSKIPWVDYFKDQLSK